MWVNAVQMDCVHGFLACECHCLFHLLFTTIPFIHTPSRAVLFQLLMAMCHHLKHNYLQNTEPCNVLCRSDTISAWSQACFWKLGVCRISKFLLQIWQTLHMLPHGDMVFIMCCNDCYNPCKAAVSLARSCIAVQCMLVSGMCFQRYHTVCLPHLVRLSKRLVLKALWAVKVPALKARLIGLLLSLQVEVSVDMQCDTCKRRRALTMSDAGYYFRTRCRRPVLCNMSESSQCPGILWVNHTGPIYWFFHDVLRVI